MSRRAKGSGFKMKGSPAKTGRIQGTPMYKASMAKATEESIVHQTRTEADAELVRMGKYLGESLIGKEIDYSLRFNMGDYGGTEEETTKDTTKPIKEMPKEYDLGQNKAQREEMNKRAEEYRKPHEDAWKKEQKRREQKV